MGDWYGQAEGHWMTPPFASHQGNSASPCGSIRMEMYVCSNPAIVSIFYWAEEGHSFASWSGQISDLFFYAC